MDNGKGSRPYQRIRFSGEASDLILVASSRSLIFRGKLPSAAACRCCRSVAKLCPVLCNPMDCSTLVLCPSLSPGVCSNSCPLSQWCYLTISSSAAHFCFCLQSFPASGSFPMSRLFTSGSQSIGRASASVLSMDIQSWFPLGLTGLISLLSKGLSRFLQYHSSKASILWHSAFFMVQLSQPYMTTGKTIALTIWMFVGKGMYLLFNTLSRFVITFLPKNKHQSPSTEI